MMDGPTTSQSFINCAGDAAVYLQEGKHYAALTPEASDREWVRRTSRPSSGQPLEDLIVIADGAGPQATLPVSSEYPDFEDLVELDAKDIATVLDVPKYPPPTATVTYAPVSPSLPPPSPARPSSPAPSSSDSSTSANTTEQTEILRQMARDMSALKEYCKITSDCMTTINNSLTTQNKSEVNATLDRVGRRLANAARSRSRSPVHRSLSGRRSPKRRR